MIVFLSFQSCIKDNFEFDKLSMSMEYNPAVAIPILKMSLDVRDILLDFDTSELITEDVSGFLYLLYEEHVFSYQGQDVIDMPDQPFGDYFSGQEVIDAGGIDPSVNLAKNTVSPFTMNNEEEVDSLVFKYANLNINVTSSFLHTGNLVISFPELKKDGVPYTVTVDINTSDGTFSFNNNYTDLEGYTFDLTNLGVDMNKVLINYDLTLNNSGSAVNSTDLVTILVTFSQMEFYSIFGYLGQQTIEIPTDSVYLEIFKKVFDGDVYFEDPKFDITLNNSYGLPIDIGFTDFYSHSVIDSTITTIYGPGIPTPFTPYEIGYPTINQIGDSVQSLLTVDKTNSNINEAIATCPKYIYFGVEGVTNPNGNTDYNFVTDSSKFDVDLEVLLPLWGRAEYLALQDTSAANFSQIPAEAERLIIRINSYNGFPLDVESQIYFYRDSLCSEDSLVDSVFINQSQMIIQSGILNADGKVVEPYHKTTDMTYTGARMDSLREHARYSRIVAYLQSTNNDQGELVRIYSYYDLEIKIGAILELMIDPSDY